MAKKDTKNSKSKAQPLDKKTTPVATLRPILRPYDLVGSTRDDLLNHFLEVSGEPRKDKAAKVATTRDLWIPGINNDGDSGRWAFLEISDPWDTQNTI